MRRCTTHALYRSMLWQQDHCQHPQNANPDGSTLEGTAQRIGRPFGRLRLWSLMWFQVRATSCHFTSSKSAWKSTPKFTWMCWRVCNQVAGGKPWVWQQDSAPAHKSKETQAWLQKECYNFVPFSHWPPSSPDLNPLDYFVWSYVDNITNMTSHNTKAILIAAIWRAPAGAWGIKKHAPSSGSVSRRWFRLKAATLNRCQLYYIIKSELNFSIEVLKLSCSVVFFRMTILSFHPVHKFLWCQSVKVTDPVPWFNHEDSTHVACLW